MRRSMWARIGMLFLVATDAWAQEPLPPPDDGPPPEPPSAFTQPETPPSSEPSVAERVARDAYLGGNGVLGPVPTFVSLATWFAPIGGGVAAAWVLEQAAPERGGRWLPSTMAALTALVVRESGARLAGALMLPVLILMQLPVVAVIALGVVGAISLLGTAAPLRTAFVPYVVAVGASWMLLAPVMIASILFIPLTTMLSRWLAVVISDRVFERFALQPSVASSAGPGSQRIPQPAPLEPLMAAGLIASTVSGRWERTAFWEHLPLVGPWMAASYARGAMVERIADARSVAGLAPGRDMRVVVDALLYSRAGLLTLGTALLLAVPAVFAVVGAATLGASGVFVFGGPAISSEALLSGLAFAYLGLVGVALAMGGVAMVSMLGAAALQDLIPWILGSVVVFEHPHSTPQDAK